MRAIAMVSVWLLAAAPARVAAAEGPELGGLIDQAGAAMQAEKWDEANRLFGEALGRLGSDPLQRHGASVGVLYYRKGLCEMKLGRHRQALSSFESCYRDFPNNAGNPGAGGNPFNKKALLRWGEAAQAAGQYQEAIELYRKFIAERDKREDDYQEGVYFINLAICHLKLGKLTEGIENLEIAINNKANFKTPTSGVVAAYQAMVEAAIAARNEQAILDFIGRNRAALALRPYVMLSYAPVVLNLAVDALAADMPRAALEMYGMVPDTRLGVADMKARVAEVESLGSLGEGMADVARLKQELARQEAALEAGQCVDAYVLEGLASIYERLRLTHAAYAAYREIGQRFPVESRRDGSLQQILSGASWSGRGLDGGLVSDEPGELGEALGLFSGRRYAEALVKFEASAQAASGKRTRDAELARFQAMECQRRLGDFDGLRKLRDGFDKDRLARKSDRIQVELYQLWDGLARGQWEEVEGKAQRWLARSDLSGPQRGQVGYCLGVACEQLGRHDDALLGYGIGMVAGGWQDETVVRDSAVGMLRTMAGDPQVKAALEARASGREDPESIGYQRLAEATQLAEVYPRFFAAGKPLPAELVDWLHPRGAEEAAGQ